MVGQLLDRDRPENWEGVDMDAQKQIMDSIKSFTTLQQQHSDAIKELTEAMKVLVKANQDTAEAVHFLVGFVQGNKN